MILFPSEKIRFNHAKSAQIKSVMESTFRLIMYSRSHLADDLLNSYIDQTTSFQELLSIKNAQMEAQNEDEALEYTLLLKQSVDFVLEEIKNDVNFESEVQLFQLFRLISPEAHSKHPNRYRQELVQIGKHLCPDPILIDSLVSEVFYQMSNIKDPIEKAIYFHHEMVRIHPFADGNGRTIRMAKNWMLMYELYPPIYISDAEEKKEYIDTLENSYDWLLKNGCQWNDYLEAFFEQESDRLLKNATIIHDRVRSVGNLREV